MGEVETQDRPKLNLSVEEIASREAEKRQLLAGIAIPTAEARAAVPRARRGRSREDLSGDYEPPVLTVVGIQEAREEMKAGLGKSYEWGVVSKITADPQELSDLVATARILEEEFFSAEEMMESARAAASNARMRLNEYMREHGLV